MNRRKRKVDISEPENNDALVAHWLEDQSLRRAERIEEKNYSWPSLLARLVEHMEYNECSVSQGELQWQRLVNFSAAESKIFTHMVNELFAIGLKMEKVHMLDSLFPVYQLFFAYESHLLLLELVMGQGSEFTLLIIDPEENIWEPAFNWEEFMDWPLTTGVII